MDARRIQRINAHIARQAAAFIATRSNTANSLITVTRADFSPQRNSAIIFVTVFPDDAAQQALAFLRRQRSALRDYLADQMRTKFLPAVDFAIDEGEKNRQRMDELTEERQ